jgi:phosphoribosylformylglycinamidine (FGAM) synthase-like enzyme
MSESEFEEQVRAMGQYEEYKNEVESLLRIRNENMSKSSLEKLRKQHSNKMKSDLKKATAFVKKIKMITSDGLLQCIRDVQTLNLTLYITEIISSLIETGTNIKVTDVNNLIKLCHELHLRYDDFILPLTTRMKETVLTQDEELQKRKRIHVRMLIEFFQLGLFTEEGFFILLLKDLTGKSQPKSAPPPLLLLPLTPAPLQPTD